MSDHFADRLHDAVRKKGAAVCVGIDPVLERLPADIRGHGTPAAALLGFGHEVLRVVAPRVPVVKINSAFFECHGGAGVEAYFELIARAAECGVLVIGDCKRGDVGHTARAYAASQFAPGGLARGAPDAVTLHSYLGWDALEPFCDAAARGGRGLYALVQTSNPSAAAVQGFVDAEGRTLSEHVGGLLQDWAAQPRRLGRCGYSYIGAVVAPRDAAVAARLRALMPSCPFLVPGYGAQGAGAEEVAACFKDDGSGAIVNASRSVIYAYEQAGAGGGSWQGCVERACSHFVEDINRVLHTRR